MRIIGYIEHPVLKITVFKMDNKISVKFENSLYEQTYKFRDSEGLENIGDVQRLVDASFIEAVMQELTKMHQIKNQVLHRFFPEEEEDFEEII